MKFEDPMGRHSDSNVRVDYVQHSVSAVMAYEAFLSGGEKKNSDANGGPLLTRLVCLLLVGIALAMFLIQLISKKRKAH